MYLSAKFNAHSLAHLAVTPVQSVVVNEKAEIHHPLCNGQQIKAKASMKLSEDG